MQSKKYSKALVLGVEKMMFDGSSDFEIKNYIAKKTGFKKTKSSGIFKEIKKSLVQKSGDVKDGEHLEWERDIESLEIPYFNKETKQYVVFLNCLGRNIVVPNEKHKNILQMYSDWDGETRTIPEICRAVKWPKSVLTEYLSKFGITHSSLPLTDEEMADKSDEDILSNLTELRKFSIFQKFEKETWNGIRGDAAKWREFEYNNVSPFISFLENWTPPKYSPVHYKQAKSKGDDTFIITCSDWHIGGNLNPLYSAKKHSWGVKEQKEFVIEYVKSIKKNIHNRADNINKLVCFWLGDIMDGLRGKTEKGTPLTQSISRDEQFNLAFDLCSYFIQEVVSLGYPVEMYSVRGNHDSLDNYTLFFALSKYFSGQKNLKFTNYNARYGLIKIKNSSIIIDHGAHDLYEAKVPRGAAAKNTYIQNLWLANKSQISDSDHLYMIAGDLHHREIMEFNEYDFILVGSPSKSLYSDANNWHSRTSQSCFLLTDKGMEENITVYFD